MSELIMNKLRFKLKVKCLINPHYAYTRPLATKQNSNERQKHHYILKPRRVICKLFREILGEKGTQNYILLLSLVFLSIGFYITYNVHIKPNLPNRYSKKTTNITLSKNGGKETMWMTIKNAEKYTNLNFDKVSLKNKLQLHFYSYSPISTNGAQ